MADSQSPPSKNGKIGLGEKLGYGVGDLPSGLYLNFFSVFLLYFFVDIGGVAPAAMGLMILLSRCFDAFTDPMMGAIADRTRTRWGRYRPYIFLGALPYGIFGFLVFATPDLSPQNLLIWAYVTYGLTMLAFTVTNVPYSGLLGVISPSARERASFTAYRMFFSASALILVGVLATTLVREIGGEDEAYGIMMTMGIFAAISVVCFIITFATTQERIPPAPANKAIRQDLKVLVSTTAWIAVGISAVLGVFSIASRAASAKFFFVYVAGDDGSPVFLFLDRFGLFLTALALGQVSGVLIGYALQRKFEKSHLLITGGALKAIGISVFYFLPLDAYWPQTAAQYLVGIGFGMLMVLSFSMFTDIAEYIDWKTGHLMTGLVVSASIFAVKFGAGLGSGFPGFVMQYTGFVPNAVQTPEAIAGINFAFGIMPFAVLLPAGAVLLFYRLTHAKMEEIETELGKRRAALD